MHLACHAASLAWLTLAASAAPPYHPLEVSGRPVESLTFEVEDRDRGRTIPLRVYLPPEGEAAPVVLFSHGLGGSRDNNPYLGRHWAGRGYAVVFVQHPGSDEEVWKDVRPAQRMPAMRRAASMNNYLDRTKDVPAVLDALAGWNERDSHALHGRLELDHVGMSGHSFGAQTTQALAGQRAARGRFSARDARIDAAVMMSPSPPAHGDPGPAFAGVEIPCLLLTGTLDKSLIAGTTPEERLEVFPQLKRAPAWQLVLDGADHMDFGERSRLGRRTRDPRYHRAILALTTAFWDATLKQDAAARAWLDGKGARSVLRPADRWQRNPAAAPPSRD